MKWQSHFFLTLFISFLLLSCSTTAVEEPDRRTKQGYLNSDPIILLHGLNGFGREQFRGYYYWGGLTDIEAHLKLAGYDVRTAAVGPVSSNWDRSCDFYAYLKGGRVDYGQNHSEKAGHDRFGRSYRGIFPEWGEIDESTGQIRKIHIIGHSMGGTTARMTAQLLEEGSEQERQTYQEDISPFFTGGKCWIKSIMTISTPHNGSTLTYVFSSYRQRELIAHLGLAFLVKWDQILLLYNDIKLDHWGWTKKKDDESESEYENRILKTMEEWSWTNKDFADFDLTPEGAWEMNSWVKARDDIYYFSWTTRMTEQKTKNKVTAYPLLSLPLVLFCQHLIKYESYRSSMINIDSAWFHNDGMVNCLSQDGPKLNSTDEIIVYKEKASLGKWNNMGELFPMDHLQIIGMSLIANTPKGYNNLEQWYEKQASMLTALP